MTAMKTEAERRIAADQALASGRIEGHVPSAEFLADSAAVVAGTMTLEEAGARSLARAKALEATNLKAQKSTTTAAA